MKDNEKTVSELIAAITKTNAFEPIENPNSTGLSPDMSDEDINDLIKRNTRDDENPYAYKYYFDEENCILYKSGYEGSLEEYIGDCLWNYADYETLIDGLKRVSDLEANEIIKEIEGDEYDLIDGYVSADFRGEV